MPSIGFSFQWRCSLHVSSRCYTPFIPPTLDSPLFAKRFIRRQCPPESCFRIPGLHCIVPPGPMSFTTQSLVVLFAFCFTSLSSPPSQYKKETLFPLFLLFRVNHTVLPPPPVFLITHQKIFSPTVNFAYDTFISIVPPDLSICIVN